MLSASEIIRVWELGQDRPLWNRALLLLGPSFPQVPQKELAALSIGRRNRCLFQVREQLLGPTMNARVDCPNCTETLEFALGVRDLCPDDSLPPVEEHYVLKERGFEVIFRLLDSHDLAIASRCSQISDVRRLLIERCIMQARAEDREIAIAEIPEPIISCLGDRLLDYDRFAEIGLSLNCPECNHAWSATFDIATFLWSEISVRAQRLLEEVHSLAVAYGWREDDILAMTAARRQYYLDKTTG